MLLYILFDRKCRRVSYGQQGECDTSSPLAKCVPSEWSQWALFCYEVHIIADDQAVCYFWYPHRGEKCVGVVVVSFYRISAGGTQALICIDVPLLLITIHVIFFTLIFLRITVFLAWMLRIFQVAAFLLESCVELWFLDWIALKDCFQHHSSLPAICSKGCFFFQLWNAANLAPVPQGVGRKIFSPAVANGNSLQLQSVPKRGESRMKPDNGHRQAELCSVNLVRFGSVYLSVLGWAAQMKLVVSVCERQSWSFSGTHPLPQFWQGKVCDTEPPGAVSG